MAQLPKDDVFIDPTPYCAQRLGNVEMQLEIGGLPDKMIVRVVTSVANAIAM